MRGCFGERRWRIALGTAAAVLLTTALPALALRVPDSSGDQLIYVYDARTNRVPFLNVANPSDDTIFLDVAFYDETLSSLGGGVIELASAANRVIDPTRDFNGVANGKAGLAVFTPVTSATDRTPVVPGEPLVGGFTLANTALGSGFGGNPFGRLAVTGSGSRASVGSTVDGSNVRYESFDPGILTVPVYFNPQTLESPEIDGNRVFLASFNDSYGNPFTINAAAQNLTATYLDGSGQQLAANGISVNGLLLSDLEALAGVSLNSSGKVFFSGASDSANFFGFFSQSLGTFASGQLMPAANIVPEGAPVGPVLDCPGGQATVSGNLTSSITWPSSCEILLDGIVFVEEGVTITIQPGTVVKGKKNPTNPPPSALIFMRGSQINANGTADQPIVFTSDQPAGQRSSGDWGGLSLNGAAPANCVGFPNCTAEGLEGLVFGGNDPNDSSGVVRYVRVEFAGRLLSIDNELNIFTMNGVGAGTTVDHVQAHIGLDDAVEWFGGTVKSKYLVASGSADDMFDWQIGFTGSVQYAYGAETGANIDTAGSNGFEGDNNEDDFNLEPRSDPRICNVTMIGTKGQTNGDVANLGMLLRRGTIGQFGQVIVTQFNTAGVEMRDAATADQACDEGGNLTGNLVAHDSIFFNCGPDGTTFASNSDTTADAVCQTTDVFAAWEADFGVKTTDPGLPAACANFGCDPVPTGNVASSFNCSTIDPSFDNNGYIGAFAPGQPSWLTTPWISFATS
jgi:hypothetical protein